MWTLVASGVDAYLLDASAGANSDLEKDKMPEALQSYCRMVLNGIKVYHKWVNNSS